MSLTDEQLKQYAVDAQQHPSLTERQKALRQLINSILQSGRLCQPQQGCFSGQYHEIHAEAVQDLLLFVCKNINRYEPERATVIAWVNTLLARRFFPEAIPKVLGPPSLQPIPLDDIETLACSENSPSLTEKLTACVESDPDNILKSECLQDAPAVNFQILVLRRLAGKSWKDIAAEFEIKVSTLSSFYSRCLGKFAEQLKVYCNEQ
jgi:hypothetical protein